MKNFAFLMIFTRDFGEACIQQEFIDKVQVLESELSELEDAAELFGTDLSSTVDFLKQNYEKPKKLDYEARKIDEAEKDLRHLPQLMIHVNEQYLTPFLYRLLFLCRVFSRNRVAFYVNLSAQNFEISITQKILFL